jgi:hypothetical protein
MAEIRVMRMGHAPHLEEMRNMHVDKACKTENKR